jgi:hypothetical protein
LLEDRLVVRRDGAFVHDGEHHLWRTLCVNLDSFSDAVLADYAHSLKIRVELETTVDKSTVASLTIESEDDLWVSVGLIKFEISEVEGFYLHWVAHQLLSCLDFDDGVI